MNNKSIYSHKELAALYFPHILPHSASQRLTHWISRDCDLLNDLQKAGYRKKQHLYTPRQIEILFDHLGNPG